MTTNSEFCDTHMSAEQYEKMLQESNTPTEVKNTSQWYIITTEQRNAVLSIFRKIQAETLGFHTIGE